jgi:hypothetical protein
MGRAMLIICAGVLVSLGIIGISTADRGKMLVKSTSKYANEITAKNAAHTGIQIAMQKISEDTTWAEYYGPGNAWTTTVNGVQDTIYVEYLNSNYATNQYWEDDSIRIVSKAGIKTDQGVHKSTVTSVYLMAKFSNLVPNPPAALSIPTNQFVPNFGGSASISGNDASGTCSDKPAIAIQNTAADTTKQNVQNEMANLKELEGNLETTDLSYEPTDELIARLKATDGAKTISGNYKGSMGTADNPGVFFVEDNAKLTGGISEGYGILVIRSYGDMAYQDSTGATVDIAGNFTFNGLVVFENAFNFDGKGTPTINGSVLIGHTQEFLDNNPTEVMNIDLSGNLHMQYDCKAQDYAKMAAANTVKQNKYTRVVTYE